MENGLPGAFANVINGFARRPACKLNPDHGSHTLGTQDRASDYDRFRRLSKHHQIVMFHRETSENRSKNYADADY